MVFVSEQPPTMKVATSARRHGAVFMSNDLPVAGGPLLNVADEEPAASEVHTTMCFGPSQNGLYQRIRSDIFHCDGDDVRSRVIL